MSFFGLSFSLFFVLNAFGSIPLFIALLSKFDPKKQRRIMLREMAIALLILLLFNFFGDNLLHLVGISRPIIGIAGGTLLFIIALGMIFPKRDRHEPSHREEPFIFPLAIPLVAGPGAISTVMVYSEQVQNPYIMCMVILFAWAPSALIILASSNIKRLIGTKGLNACQKLGGMLISLIAVQMFCTGLLNLLNSPA